MPKKTLTDIRIESMYHANAVNTEMWDKITGIVGKLFDSIDEQLDAIDEIGDLAKAVRALRKASATIKNIKE